MSFTISVNSANRREESVTDMQKLGMALDYFTANKYHEALIIFIQLDKKYKLNYRFKAYIGICYYYEWQYAEACKYLDEAIPHLDAYSPDERSVYYNIAAESHFELKEYVKAIPLYEKRFVVCKNREKGDALYRLGFCYMFLEKWANAAEYFKSAEAYYTKYSHEDSRINMRQLNNMINGCEEKQNNSQTNLSEVLRE